MNKSYILGEAAGRIVSNGWDLPSTSRKHSKSSSYNGPCLQNQERIKEAGRLAQQSAELQEVLVGYILEVYGHFYRSQESAFNQNRKHPEFEEYLTHWFYSAPNYVESRARGYLKKWYTQPSVLRILPGKTFWWYRRTEGPPGSC